MTHNYESNELTVSLTPEEVKQALLDYVSKSHKTTDVQSSKVSITESNSATVVLSYV